MILVGLKMTSLTVNGESIYVVGCNIRHSTERSSNTWRQCRRRHRRRPDRMIEVPVVSDNDQGKVMMFHNIVKLLDWNQK
jgi:hypothetical protein